MLISRHARRRAAHILSAVPPYFASRRPISPWYLGYMRAALLGLVLGGWTTDALAQIFSFENLSQQARHAPDNIVTAMQKLVPDEIADCQKQLHASNDDMHHYFTATPVDLKADKQTLLVLPSNYCYAFFGAHAIGFWLFEMRDKGPKLLLSGVQDAMEVKPRKTGGMPEIMTYYGSSEVHRYRYKGGIYVEREVQPDAPSDDASAAAAHHH
jgi:hypothetical protein